MAFTPAVLAAAQAYAEALTEKFSQEEAPFPPMITVEPRRRYIRLMKVNTYPSGTSRSSVHAFVDQEGHLLKPAGLTTPVLDPRGELLTNEGFSAAVARADSCGGYLYKK